MISVEGKNGWSLHSCMLLDFIIVLLFLVEKASALVMYYLYIFIFSRSLLSSSPCCCCCCLFMFAWSSRCRGWCCGRDMICGCTSHCCWWLGSGRVSLLAAASSWIEVIIIMSHERSDMKRLRIRLLAWERTREQRSRPSTTGIGGHLGLAHARGGL